MTKSKGDRTHISIILDRTGSMECIRMDTIGGFNTFLKEQQAQPTPATLTLVQFDSQDPYEVIQKFTDIKLVPKLTQKTYVPRGSTPLYDAMGRGINDLKSSLDGMPEELRPKKIVMVIVTDGQENASREFTGEQVKRMIAEMKKAGWQFVFLSADEAAITDGSDLNIDACYSMAVGKHAGGAQRMWKRVSERSEAFRSGIIPCMRMDDPMFDAPTCDVPDAANGDARNGEAPDAAPKPPSKKKR